MKMKRAISTVLTLLLIVSMSACAAQGKKLTIDTFLTAETRDDIIELLGEPSSSESGDDHYDSVMYMGDTYSTLVNYYSDGVLNALVMHYYYEGMRAHLDSVTEMFDYALTPNDRQLAKESLETVACELAEKYGDPKVYDSPIDTTTYTWYVGDCEIQLEDHTENDQFKVLGAYEITIYY